jgi:tetratricopeptide (TPR) repeat protein
MTILSLARILYSTGQYEEAVRRYDLIADSSDHWLESLFEKSWAYYQMNNYARALGNLQTVNSPYFEEEYYPEAHVLKATIYFKNCHYEDALETVNPFYKDYYEILKELEGALAAHTDAMDFYNYLAAVSVRGGAYSLKVKKIFNAAVSDKKVKRLFQFVVHISKEIQQLEELRKHPVARAMADFLLPDVVAYRALTTGEAGKLARERLTRMRKELKDLLSKALTIRLETLNAQKGILDEKLRKEQVVEAKTTSEESEYLDTDAEHLQWSFDGEFWKDELGSYYHPLRSLCGAEK